MANRFLEFLNQIMKLTGLNFGIGFVTAGMLSSTIILAILWISLASIMSVEEYGKISYLLAISTIGMIFSRFGLRVTMLSYVSKGIKELRNQINSFILISTITIAFLVFIIFQSISISILIIGVVFFTFSTGECLAYKKYKEFAILEIGARSTQSALAFIFYFMGGIEFVLIGYGLGCIPFSYRYFSSLRFFKFRFNELLSRIRFVLHSFSLQLANNAQWYDKILIAFLLDYYVLGQYQIGINFLIIVGIVPQILFQYLLPQHATGFSQTRIRYTGIIITIILVIIFLASIPSIINNLFPKYIETISTIQIILFAGIPLSINSIASAKLLGLGQSKYVFYGSLLFVLVETMFILTLGLTYSTLGLAVGIVLALSFQASFLLISERFVKSKMMENI